MWLQSFCKCQEFCILSGVGTWWESQFWRSQPTWNYQSWQSTCSLVANRGCSKLYSRSDWLQIKRFEIQTIRQFSTSDRLCRQSKRKTKTPMLQDGAWSEQETQCSKSSYCKRISMLHVGYDDWSHHISQKSHHAANIKVRPLKRCNADDVCMQPWHHHPAVMVGN